MDTIENPITGAKISIAKKEFPEKLTWTEAKKNCASLGDGWRLPTIEELREIFLHKNEIDGFKGQYYWSCTEHEDIDLAWCYDFHNKNKADMGKYHRYSVRAVKPL
jgi:hypothetical protein